MILYIKEISGGSVMDDILNKIKKGALQFKDEAEKFTKDAVDKTKKAIAKILQ